jgi:hypothetical protein
MFSDYTKAALESRVATLNMMLERPLTRFRDDSTNTMNVGHLSLDKDQTGYKLTEIVSEGGGEHDWTQRLKPKEMLIAISGMLDGIALRNRHVEGILLKGTLKSVGITPVNDMYSDGNSALLRKAVADGEIIL